MPSEFDDQRTWGPTPSYPIVRSVPHVEREMLVIAGPCSVESIDQMESVCTTLSRVGVTYVRGGVYRAGTYPPESFGLQFEKLKMMRVVADRHGLKVLVELLDVRQLEKIDPYVDALQVGARHMQDYALLDRLAKYPKPVTLKRHPGSTMDEFFGAAEYLLRYGKRDVTLIERGSVTFQRHVRWGVDVSVIAGVKSLTGIPIVVDASHGSGRRDFVEPLLLAGMGAGADGFLIEVHPTPAVSLSDAEQAVPLAYLDTIKLRAQLIHQLVRGQFRTEAEPMYGRLQEGHA